MSERQSPRSVARAFVKVIAPVRSWRVWRNQLHIRYCRWCSL